MSYEILSISSYTLKHITQQRDSKTSLDWLPGGSAGEKTANSIQIKNQNQKNLVGLFNTTNLVSKYWHHLWRLGKDNPGNF